MKKKVVTGIVFGDVTESNIYPRLFRGFIFQCLV